MCTGQGSAAVAVLAVSMGSAATAKEAQEIKSLYGYEMLAAQKLAAAGTPANEIAAIFPSRIPT